MLVGRWREAHTRAAGAHELAVRVPVHVLLIVQVVLIVFEILMGTKRGRIFEKPGRQIRNLQQAVPEQAANTLSGIRLARGLHKNMRRCASVRHTWS